MAKKFIYVRHAPWPSIDMKKQAASLETGGRDMVCYKYTEMTEKERDNFNMIRKIFSIDDRGQ